MGDVCRARSDLFLSVSLLCETHSKHDNRTWTVEYEVVIIVASKLLLKPIHVF